MEKYFNKLYNKETIDFLEKEYPGPYIVYHYKTFPVTELFKYGFKIGCTTNLKQRNKSLSWRTGTDLELPEVILNTNSLLEAAVKERELAKSLNLPGNTDYILDLIRHSKCKSKQVRNKAVQSTDYASFQHKRLSSYDWNKRKLKISRPVKGYEVLEYRRPSKKNPAKIIKKKYIGEWINAYEAADALNLYQADIANVLRPKSRCLTIHGYTFEYA